MIAIVIVIEIIVALLVLRWRGLIQSAHIVMAVDDIYHEVNCDDCDCNDNCDFD